MQRKLINVIAKRINPKSVFVKLFEPNNFITLLYVYRAYDKTKNILHIYGVKAEKMLRNAYILYGRGKMFGNKKSAPHKT